MTEVDYLIKQVLEGVRPKKLKRKSMYSDDPDHFVDAMMRSSRPPRAQRRRNKMANPIPRERRLSQDNHPKYSARDSDHYHYHHGAR